MFGFSWRQISNQLGQPSIAELLDPFQGRIFKLKHIRRCNEFLANSLYQLSCPIINIIRHDPCVDGLLMGYSWQESIMPDDSRTRTTPVTFQLDLETATALADPVTRARIERLIRRTARPLAGSVDRLFAAMDGGRP